MRLYFETPLCWEAHPRDNLSPPLIIIKPWARPVRIFFSPDKWPDKDSRRALFSLIMMREHGYWSVCPRNATGESYIFKSIKSTFKEECNLLPSREKRWFENHKKEVMQAIFRLFVNLMVFRWMKSQFPEKPPDWFMNEFKNFERVISGSGKISSIESTLIKHAVSWARYSSSAITSDIFTAFDKVVDPFPEYSEWKLRIEQLTKFMITWWNGVRKRQKKAGLIKRGRPSQVDKNGSDIFNRQDYLETLCEDIEADSLARIIPWLMKEKMAAGSLIGNISWQPGLKPQWSKPILLVDPPRLYPSAPLVCTIDENSDSDSGKKPADLAFVLDVSGSLGDPMDDSSFARALLATFFGIMEASDAKRRWAALVFAKENRYSGWQPHENIHLVKQTLLMCPGASRTFLSPVYLENLQNGARPGSIFLLATDGKFGQRTKEISENIAALKPVFRKIADRNKLFLILTDKEESGRLLVDAVRESNGKVISVHDPGKLTRIVSKITF